MVILQSKGWFWDNKKLNPPCVL